MIDKRAEKSALFLVLEAVVVTTVKFLLKEKNIRKDLTNRKLYGINNLTKYDYTVTNNRIVTVYNRYTNKGAVARCHPDDCCYAKFNRKYGIALAYCRLKNIEFPKIKIINQVYINNLKYGDEFIYRNTQSAYNNCKFTYVGKNPVDKSKCIAVLSNSGAGDDGGALLDFDRITIVDLITTE